ncbi:MAG TPA: hypothetical protein DEA47_03235 [Peptococcaceae bacterium]|nr:MAG: N-acetylmuramoyl-L-alanine amidase [Clostridia bacterium 41_269]HBT20369.1 hypothetical protein [Peptococcaceae bacterium]
MCPLNVRVRGIIFCAVLLLVSIIAFPENAGAVGIKIFVDGKQISTDVEPYIDSNNRTMVPLRFVSESLGAKVDWTHGEKEILITKDAVQIKLFLGKAVMERNGKEIKIDTAPVLKNSRAMVPLRFVSERLGCNVNWDDVQKAVYISSKVCKASSEEKDADKENSGSDGGTSEIKRGYVTGSIVNIRSGPGTNYSIVGQVRQGAPLVVYDEKDGWYRVSTTTGIKGWIAGWLVSLSGDSSRGSGGGGDRDDIPTGNTDNTTAAIVIVGSANIRSGPSTSYPVTATCCKGEEVLILGEQDGWFRVRKESIEGFISKGIVAVKQSPKKVYPTPLNGRIIVIDPGHGSVKSGGLVDPGAVGPSGLKEKDVVLIIAQRAGEILSSKGATVIYTRTDDTYMGLSQRAELANNYGADVFVSIHCNASLSTEVQGTSTYYYVSLSMTQDKIDARRKLAALVQEELVKELGRKNLGLKEGNFLVLRNTTMPSILVETAFISNPTEERLLADPSFCRRAGEAIARGIIRYFETES